MDKGRERNRAHGLADGIDRQTSADQKSVQSFRVRLTQTCI